MIISARSQINGLFQQTVVEILRTTPLKQMRGALADEKEKKFCALGAIFKTAGWRFDSGSVQHPEIKEIDEISEDVVWQLHPTDPKDEQLLKSKVNLSCRICRNNKDPYYDEEKFDLVALIVHFNDEHRFSFDKIADELELAKVGLARPLKPEPFSETRKTQIGKLIEKERAGK